MKYNKEWLESEIEKGTEFEYFGFWGQKNESESERAMSNFYRVSFPVKILHGDRKGEVVNFSCSEQYFMYLKAITFKDYLAADKIAFNNNKPGVFYQKLGRSVGNLEINPAAAKFDKEYWDDNSMYIMILVLRAKFSSEKMQKMLLDTGDAILIEASPIDSLWGVKLAKYNRNKVYDETEAWKDVKKWKGKNMLGFALMEIRDELNKEKKD